MNMYSVFIPFLCQHYKQSVNNDDNDNDNDDDNRQQL